MNKQTYLVDDFNQTYLHDASDEILNLYKNLKPYRDHTVEEKDQRGHILRRPLFSHSSLPDLCFNFEPIKVSEYDGTFDTSYYVLLHHHIELAAKNIDRIPEVILNYIKDKKCKLVLDDTLEGDKLDYFLPILYESIDNLNLPADQIYYITNNLLGEDVHNKWCKTHKRDSYINLISFMWNVYDINRLIKDKNLPSELDIEEEIKYKKSKLNNIKHFLKVNRTNRPERNLMMLFMNKHNILDKSLVSFPTLPEETYHEVFSDLVDKQNIETLSALVPFDIDQTDVDNHGEPGLGIGKFDADLPFQPIHYRNSFFSIVMCAFPETENACHLHSSTFNPMWCGHPVIQYGPYHHLKELQRRGFKTFSRWWDESYDNMKNSHKRLRAVMNIVLKLSKLSPNEILNMYIEMKDVLQHNHNLMKNYSIDKNLKDRIYESKFL